MKKFLRILSKKKFVIIKFLILCFVLIATIYIVSVITKISLLALRIESLFIPMSLCQEHGLIIKTRCELLYKCLYQHLEASIF